MSHSIQCSECGTHYRMNEEKAGMKLRCKACGAVIAVRGADPRDNETSAALPPRGRQETSPRSQREQAARSPSARLWISGSVSGVAVIGSFRLSFHRRLDRSSRLRRLRPLKSAHLPDVGRNGSSNERDSTWQTVFRSQHPSARSRSGNAEWPVERRPVRSGICRAGPASSPGERTAFRLDLFIHCARIVRQTLRRPV